MGIENVGIDSVGNDGPVRLEVAIQRNRCRMRNGDRSVELVEALLEVSVANRVEKRAVEVGVKSSHHRTVCFFDRQHWQHRAQRRMYVDDVVLAKAEHSAQALSKLESPGKSSL